MQFELYKNIKLKNKKVTAGSMPPGNSIQNMLHRFSGFQTCYTGLQIIKNQ